MREFRNNTLKSLTFEEHDAILTASKILSDAFKVKIWGVSINGHQQDREQIWGIAFSFDMEDQGYR